MPPPWSTLNVAVLGALSATLGLWAGRATASDTPPPAARSAAQAVARPSSSTPISVHPPSDQAWDKRWTELNRRPPSSRRDSELATLVEELARTDPQRALRVASSEPNWALADALRDAAMRGWGSVAPDAAVDWALGNRLDIRMHCVSAALAGAAAANPPEAVRVALRACQSDPEPAADYGHALITALVEKSDAFAEATRFAAAVGTDRQQHLLDSAYYQWARHQPDQALAALASLADPKLRASAYEGLLSGWAAADAQKLADLALQLPPGEARARALAVALPRWVEKDPATAAEWLGRFDPSPDLDAGIASVSTQPAFIAGTPATAMDLSDNILDRAQRLATKHEIITQWAGRDLPAARRFAEAVKKPDERDMMLEALASHPSTTD